MTQNKKINLLLEVLGCFISAAGIYSFAVAAEVPVTGVAGISAILYRLFGLPMGLSNVLINVPIIFFSYKLLGRSFLLRSLRCMIIVSPCALSMSRAAKTSSRISAVGGCGTLWSMQGSRNEISSRKARRE